MIDCIIAGDSNAVTLQPFMSECQLVGRPGIHSQQFNNLYPQQLDANTVVVALATNDHLWINTMAELKALRSRITAQRVIWILPTGNLPANRVPIEIIQSYVRAVASINQDLVLTVPSTQADRLHPSWAAGCAIAEQVGHSLGPTPTQQELFCLKQGRRR